MATSITQKILHNPATRTMGDPLWVQHVLDHRKYLEENSEYVRIDPYVLVTRKHKPFDVLNSLNVPVKYKHTVLILNRVSPTEGFSSTQTRLYIPTEEALDVLFDSFIGELSSN